jgi:cob(I)alamin adenosyltransferase
MALFTGKGDNGTTTTFGCNQKISKSSAIAEALGSLDEVNSYLGFCKVRSKELTLEIYDGLHFHVLVHGMQEHLFKIQAELAGFPMQIEEKKVKDMEEVIHAIEKMLPPIKTFFISGGTELAATFDFARTLARRAERRVVAVADSASAEASADKGISVPVSKMTLAYMNRLSSVLYALARLANHKAGYVEEPPTYA